MFRGDRSNVPSGETNEALIEFSKSLFFHHTRKLSSVDRIVNREMVFGLTGRATFQRGAIFNDGINLIFHVPEFEQNTWFESPYDSGYETWALGSTTLLALRQPVPYESKHDVENWLRAMKKEKEFNGKTLNFKDVRYIPTHLLIGVVGVLRSRLTEKSILLPSEIRLLTVRNDAPFQNEQSLLQLLKIYESQK